MKIKGLTVVPAAIVGTSLGLGIIGDKINSEGLKNAGQTAGKFIAPAIGISMGGFLIKQIREFKKI